MKSVEKQNNPNPSNLDYSIIYIYTYICINI